MKNHQAEQSGSRAALQGRGRQEEAVNSGTPPFQISPRKRLGCLRRFPSRVLAICCVRARQAEEKAARKRILARAPSLGEGASNAGADEI